MARTQIKYSTDVFGDIQILASKILKTLKIFLTLDDFLSILKLWDLLISLSIYSNVN